MKQKTTYNDLPQRVDEIYLQLLEIRELIETRIRKAEEIPKLLTIDRTLSYLHGCGVKMSKTKLYQIARSEELPSYNIDNRLIFKLNDINEWLQKQLS